MQLLNVQFSKGIQRFWKDNWTRVFLRELRVYFRFYRKKLTEELEFYLEETIKLKKEYPESFNLWNVLGFFSFWQHKLDSKRYAIVWYCPWTTFTLSRFFPSWRETLEIKRNAVTDGIPWMTFAAIELLKKITTRNTLVYEYGSGGSTLFFAKRVKKIISIEHDPNWASRMIELVKKSNYANVEIRLIKPVLDSTSLHGNIADPDSYISDDEQYQGCSFREYAASIDRYPDAYFDIIVIDGRSRPSCFKHALDKVKVGGYIIWDNTDRPYYFSAMQLADSKFVFIDLPGPSPYQNTFTRTSAWLRITEN